MTGFRGRPGRPGIRPQRLPGRFPARRKSPSGPSPPDTPAAGRPRRRRNNPLSGALYLLRGAAIVARPGIRRYAAVPLLINACLFTALIWLGASWLAGFVESTVPDWLGGEFTSWVLAPVLALYVGAVLVAGFFTFNLVANLVAAPFNGLLAEAVERRLTGLPPPSGGWRALVAGLGTAFATEARKLAYVAVRTLPLLVLFLVPGVNAVAPFLWLLLGAWMLAFAYLDYPMANHGIGFAGQRRRLHGHRLLGLGFGGAVMAALAVPLLNFIVIPCAVAGATAMWVEQLDGGADAAPPAPAQER